ncbi:hypothetical protein [Nitrosococcus wardiae]|uniref:Uncharacterized protein n=1 Tax=Nitrosococcus wardiae TaxID=1814290 RepID=A0A4P7C1K9_9GAMM|nr:hypothetical protein [Nitrosococcus wardiae]QBQ55569.1 hypothetical protein E3U44_14410 [Nitrosococcus wardiae]
MPPLNTEKERINLLLQRDGLEATQNWVARTLNIYREAVASPASHASQKNYKPLFEKSIQEFEEWLSLTQEHNSLIPF